MRSSELPSAGLVVVRLPRGSPSLPTDRPYVPPGAIAERARVGVERLLSELEPGIEASVRALDTAEGPYPRASFVRGAPGLGEAMDALRRALSALDVAAPVSVLSARRIISDQ